ncbi:MAG: J domain-containing protein, partial [Coriobacteriales bacterium]
FGSDWDFNVNRAQNGRDLQTSIELTFDEAFKGTTKQVSVRIPSTGETESIKVKVPAGAVDGGKLRFRQRGEYGSGGGKRGDLIIVTKIKEHPVYRRDHADVLMDLPVSVEEAILGTRVVVPTPDGSLVKLRIPAGTQDGRVLRVKGKGAHDVKGSGNGDLKVKVKVAIPKSLNAEQRAAIEKFRDASPDPAQLRTNIDAQVARVKA